MLQNFVRNVAMASDSVFSMRIQDVAEDVDMGSQGGVGSWRSSLCRPGIKGLLGYDFLHLGTAKEIVGNGALVDLIEQDVSWCQR